MNCTFITYKSNLFIYSGITKSNKVNINWEFQFFSMWFKNITQMKFMYCK